MAYDGSDRIVVQTRQPATLWIQGDPPRVLWLDPRDRGDTGHDLFHGNPGSSIACASCHPEGGDDGRAWSFARFGLRRTPSVRIGLDGTQPFHWQGDLPGLPELVHEVFEDRMGAPPTTGDQIAALGHWMFALAPVPASTPGAPEAVERGRLLFHDHLVGCAGCHSGPKLTSNATVDVDTGGSFQVPSLLGVAHRAPFLHDGRAATLADRFGDGGGGDRHGHTSRLTPAQIADLVAYLESL